MHTLPLLTISSNRQSQPAIDSSSKGTELKWVRDRSGRLVRPDNTPIQEKLNSGFETVESMADRQNVENSRIDLNEPRYTRAEVQLLARNECEYDLEKSVGDTLGRGLIEKFHKLAKFDGSGDPAEHLEQYALSIRLNRLPASFMLDWFSTSLQGPALMWYRNLEKRKKASWT